jgi:hypothetical protein
MTEKGKSAFVQKLNKLQPFSGGFGIDSLADRRKEDKSSSAPRTLFDSIQSMHNTTPANDIKNEPPTGE